MPLKLPLSLPPWIPCFHCNRGLDLTKISFNFHEKKPECPHCKENVDWWDTILNAVKSNLHFGQILAPVGARSKLFEVDLAPTHATIVKFADHNIPLDANILDINYNSDNDGGLFPLEFHGNAPLRHFIPNEIALYPARVPIGKEVKETKIRIFVTWIPHTENDEAWKNLVDAFEAYSQKRYNRCIVPANVAVESKLSKLLMRYLKSYASKKNVEDFMNNGAKYSHQLNIMLPLVASHTKVPLLSENIRGQLNLLREYRNDIAHEGKTDKPIKKEDAAQLIVSALFGFHYLNFIEQEIKKATT